MPIVVFDVYGTLLDVYSVQKLLEKIFPNKGKEISILWRDKQIEYTRLIAMSNKEILYKSFWQVTVDALDFSLKRLKVSCDQMDRKRILDSYLSLSVFSESFDVLSNLKEKKFTLAVLSNGNFEMLTTALNHSKIFNFFDNVFSAEKVFSYKIDPQVYGLVESHYGLSPDNYLLVSSNFWDITGGGWYGFKTFWVNRTNSPMENLGYSPNKVGNNLYDLVKYLEKT